MKLPATLLAASLVTSTLGFTPNKQIKHSSLSKLASAKDDLVEFAKELNPVIKYYDPMNLASKESWNFWDKSEDAAIGFLRHSEVKHGRVAMAAFIGYCVQSNFIFPWPQHLDGTTGPGIDLSPEQQWDDIPALAKWQIIFVIGFLEIWDECGGGYLPHYMNGRKAGQYPSFDMFRENIHFVLDLYDPFGFSKKRSEADKAKGLIAETNNGRLAMLGIFGFVSADKVPGSVPGLVDIATPYDGNIMAPFEFNWEI